MARQPEATWFFCTVICLRSTAGRYEIWPLKSMKPCRRIAIFPLFQPRDSVAPDRTFRLSIQLFRLNHPFRASKSCCLLQKAQDHHHQFTLACNASIRPGRNHVFGGSWETSELWSSPGYQFGFSSVNPRDRGFRKSHWVKLKGTQQNWQFVTADAFKLQVTLAKESPLKCSGSLQKGCGLMDQLCVSK